jgi:ABC-type branched-subunit amino acid transport system permease subunit
MEYLIYLIALLGINTVLVTGMNLVIGVGGVAALNAGVCFGYGAYAYGIATTAGGLNPVVALLLAPVVTAVVSGPEPC